LTKYGTGEDFISRRTTSVTENARRNVEPTQQETKKMKAFHQALLSSGLVKTIKKPRFTSTDEHKLIPVQGKPVWETIIDERR